MLVFFFTFFLNYIELNSKLVTNGAQRELVSEKSFCLNSQLELFSIVLREKSKSKIINFAPILSSISLLNCAIQITKPRVKALTKPF